MTNLQDGVPVLGDLPLLPNTYYSVELLVQHFVPERNVTLVFPLEEDVRFVGDVGGDADWLWAFGQQRRLHLVKPSVHGPPLREIDGKGRESDL
jgi:hypothetical protein